MIQGVNQNGFIAYHRAVARQNQAAARVAQSGALEPADAVQIKSASLQASAGAGLIKAENGAIGALLDLLA